MKFIRKIYEISFVLFLIFVLLPGCKKEPDVATLDSGLKYANDSLGTGNSAKMGDLVTIHYAAWIIKDSSNLYSDWTKDSSKNSLSIGNSKIFKQPVKFRLSPGQFIRGSEEGIAGMKVGGKRTLIIPSFLAYGKEGYGPVPPNSNLKIVIELLDTREIPEVKQWNVDTTKAKASKSGLKYVIIEEGTGSNPKSGDIVSVNYSGFLLDGKKFDSSIDRGMPYLFTVGRNSVIKGWEEGIALLKKGGKAKLIIPPSLAYGAQGMDPAIPPNATLIFDVELVDIK